MGARKPGIHFGEPHEISGHLPNAGSVARIDDTIQKISNNIKAGQIEYGPTVLVVDLGRFNIGLDTTTGSTTVRADNDRHRG